MRVFMSGTTTPATVFQDKNLTVPHPNPIVASSDGKFPAIYARPGVSYRVQVTTAAGAAIPGYDFDPVVAPISSSDFFPSSIAALQALPSGTPLTFLNAGPRSGHFQWVPGDQSANVSADPLHGIYIAPLTDASGASGCWERVWDGVHGRPEWFGATANNPGTDNSPAINACISVCPVTQLGTGKYYIGSAEQGAGSVCIPITTNGRVIQGVAQTQDNLAPNHENLTATQLVITNGYASGIRIGTASNPGGGTPTWVEGVVVQNLSIIRSVTILNPISGTANSPCGLIMQWANLCEVRNVWAKEHSFGFYTGGTVACRYEKCRSLRYTAGKNPGNDFWAGFYQDSGFPSGYNASNASLVYDRCGAFSNYFNVNYTYNAGMQLDKAFTDTFVLHFETATTGYGIDATGTTTTGFDWFTENLSIVDPIVDGCRFAGIRIANTGPRTSVTITSGYCGSTVATGPASIGVHIYESHGAVSINNFRCLVETGSPATGLLIENSSGVTAYANQWIDFQDPIRLVNSVWCDLRDRCMQVSQSVPTAAVQLTASSYNILACSVASSNPTITLPAGVVLNGTACTHNEVNCSGIYAPSLSGGSANKLKYNGTQITSPGAFGTGNAASGIMS